MNLVINSELADKLDEWANQREPKLPDHIRQGNMVHDQIGHISFCGSLLKALGNLPDLVLTWLRSNMPEQLDSIHKDLNDLYEKVRFVDHERTDTGEEANIAKCQAQAAAKKLAEKLRFLADLHRKQIETKGQPGEPEQKAKGGKIMITGRTSKENWEAIRSEYDISKKDFGKKINFVSDSFKKGNHIS